MSLPPPEVPSQGRSVVLGAMGFLLLLGLGLRLRFLDEGSLFIDEAESSINALSILEHGYPSDRYLGLPMFENTLVDPWPESAEYEFRDSSYSRRGMAIYHGWLPLYAIAASLALHGIGPDRVTDPPSAKHTDEEIRTRIRAARMPAVVFAALFLVAIFLAGAALYGVDAGLAAMLAATFVPKCVWLAQQARYHSAALAFSTLAAWCAWRVYRRGGWRDFLLAALVFVLLFHTSGMAFALALLSSLVLLPGILRHERAWTKLGSWCALLALGLLPWMLWTGFLDHPSFPKARSLLDFPEDYLIYLRARPARLAGGTALLATFALLWLARARLPERCRRPLENSGMPILFLTGWIVTSYFGFQLLVPAASCFTAGLSNVLIVAPILLGSVGLAVLARMLLPGNSTPLALAGTLVLLAATGNLLRWQHRNDVEARAVFELVEHLRGLKLTRNARLYAFPYQHLCLTYYTGLPVQSIAPVRREFLDSFPGEVLILETTTRVPQPLGEWVRRFAREQLRQGLSPLEASQWAAPLQALMIGDEVRPLVRAYSPEPGPMPEWVAPVVAGLRREIELSRHGCRDYARDNPAIFKGYPAMTLVDFWPVFFYRFVGPERRSGEHVNYAGRMREAEAVMLPSTWVVLHCPARAEEER